MRLFVPVRYPRSRHLDTPSHKNSLAPTESPSLGSTSKTCSRSSAIDCCHGFGQPLLRARAFLALHLSGRGRMPYRTGDRGIPTWLERTWASYGEPVRSILKGNGAEEYYGGADHCEGYQKQKTYRKIGLQKLHSVTRDYASISLCIGLLCSYPRNRCSNPHYGRDWRGTAHSRS